MNLARVFMGDSIDPAPQYERFRFDGIRFYRCTFPAGASQTYLYPAPVRYCEMPSCHLQVSGLMVEPTGVWPDQREGWISRAEQFIIPAGVFTRLAATDVVRWCCTGVADGESTDYVTPLSMEAGATRVLQTGENFLLADGELSVDGVRFTFPRRLKVEHTQRTLRAETKVFAFTWRTADVLARYQADENLS